MKDLIVICAPDTSERGTEVHFASLFRQLHWVVPPHMGLGEDNAKPNENTVLLFEGGTDINPLLYDEQPASGTQKPDYERDKHEILQFKLAIEAKAPMIGICRGAQLLCALNGGKLIQHVNGHSNAGYRHRMQLPKCFKNEWIEVTSAHHQMMNPYNLPQEAWKSLGHVPHPQSNKYWGPNGKIKVHKLYNDFKEQEIIWFPNTKCLCIQGHPEYIQSPQNAFVQYCRMLVRILILGEKSSYDILA